MWIGGTRSSGSGWLTRVTFRTDGNPNCMYPRHTMSVFRKYSIALGAAGAVALLLTLSLPRGVHAVAPALVQVGNIAANPAVTQDSSRAASQIVELEAFSGNGEYQLLQQVSNTGKISSSAFTVPNGQYFVVTSVEIAPSIGGPGYDYVYLTDGETANHREYWMVPQSSTTQFQFPAGLVFGPRQTIGLYAPSAAGLVYLYVHGYLTTN